jgi:hypothetical protein
VEDGTRKKDLGQRLMSTQSASKPQIRQDWMIVGRQTTAIIDEASAVKLICNLIDNAAITQSQTLM